VSVGLDSMVLVYAGIVPSNPATRADDFADLQVRAHILLHKLARRDAIIYLPTVAIAELLVPVPKAQKGLLIAKLAEKFVCPNFDLHAAAIAAELWAQHKQLPHDLQYKNRHLLKADILITSSARAAGAVEFYSHDKRCRALAAMIMQAHDLPREDPEDMFLKGDLQRGEVELPERFTGRKKK